MGQKNQKNENMANKSISIAHISTVNMSKSCPTVAQLILDRCGFTAIRVGNSVTDYFRKLTPRNIEKTKVVHKSASFAHRSNIIALFYSNMGCLFHLENAEFASDACGYLYD